MSFKFSLLKKSVQKVIDNNQFLSNTQVKVIGSSQHRLGIKVCVTYFVSTGIETPEYVIERRDFYCMFSVQ